VKEPDEPYLIGIREGLVGLAYLLELLVGERIIGILRGQV
jgi:hypothetical protein